LFNSKTNRSKIRV